MITVKIGDRVSLTEDALSLPYVKGRRWYTDVYAGKKGTIIGFTANSSKLAIEFDEIIFTRPDGKISSHDNGCHGRGKSKYCWYIPLSCVTLINEPEITNDLILLI